MPIRILVADDDRVVCAQLCGVLRSAGYTPLPAYDSMQAVMFAMKEPVPDIIILDVNMPGGTGLDALRKIRMSAKTNHVPVLVVSGSADKTLADKATELGANGFLSKPVEPEALRDAVAKLIPETPPKR